MLLLTLACCKNNDVNRHHELTKNVCCVSYRLIKGVSVFRAGNIWPCYDCLHLDCGTNAASMKELNIELL